MDTIRVVNEFAPLRTVVLAQSELAVPESARDNADMRFLPDDSDLLSFTGDMRQAEPQRQSAWEAERDTFAAVLDRHGVTVLRPRLLTSAEKSAAGPDGYANFFARDPFFTIGDHVIEGSLRFRHRRNEVLPMREVFTEHVYPADCSYVAVPRPEIPAPDDPTLGPGPFLEGGDVLVLDDHVFVGSSGLASNDRGTDWLRKYLGPYGYTVEQVRLDETILHLDCALGLIRDGLMVLCKAALPDGVPERLRDWDRIEVPLSEAPRLATNGLPLSPDVYVTDPEFAWIGAQLEQRGIAVEYVDFTVTRSLGGSFRCSTQPLRRAA